jgi:archaemetzincin
MDKGEGFLACALSRRTEPLTVGIFAFLAILGCSSNEFRHRSEKQKMAWKQEKICVLAIGKLDSTLLEKLAADLERTFERKAEISRIPLDLEFAYNPERKQYHSSTILERLRRMGPEDCGRTLGIVDVDLYVPDLNFVFGEANVVTKTAVIAKERLKPEYYGLAEDPTLLGERILKESVHELGHTYGLGHCSDRKCVMHFSNGLADTDFKSSSFCESCKGKLMSIKKLRSLKTEGQS